MTVRLDFYLATNTRLSRKEARRHIQAGEVSIDGVVCRKSATHISADQQVHWQDEAIELAGERYLMLNKPAGVVSAREDRDHPTVLDLLPPDECAGLHIVGRLDMDTTGLLLLTTDGQWSHRITSPKSHCPKTYRAQLAEPLSEEAHAALERGVQLKDELRPTAPASLSAIGPDGIELTITEGRYHQVKRMLAAVGNHVTALHRVRIGGIRLDESLAPGQYRALSAKEIASAGRQGSAPVSC
ncbi:MAG: pseudouridine synthase [Oleiphilaceae bacterium]|nr:pseudouridine synthase [Oleiphilaceae bacterium]